MRTAPPAHAPKSTRTDAQVAAYMASDKGRAEKWLAFERDYLESLED